MCMVPSCESVSCPFNSQDQPSALRGWRSGSVSATSSLPASLNSTSFLGLTPQHADMLSATIFRSSVNVGWVFQNETHSASTIQPSNSLVLMDLNESNASVYTETCIWTFTAALFITARTWKQPRCPSGGEWTDRRGSIHAAECSSH